jgi:hypothetical protein
MAGATVLGLRTRQAVHYYYDKASNRPPGHLAAIFAFAGMMSTGCCARAQTTSTRIDAEA